MKTHSNRLLIIFIVLSAFVCLDIAYAERQVSTNYIIQENVIDVGGNDGSSANYDLLYSIGQPSIIGDLASNNYFLHAGYWNAVSGIPENHHVSGSGFNYPEAGYRASLSLDVNSLSLETSWLEYYYSKLRMHCKSTAITKVSVIGNTIVIEGECKVNGVEGYTFEATILDGSPDIMSIVIYNPDSTVYFQTTPTTMSNGNYSADVPVTCVSLPARIAGTTPAYYPLLQDAYGTASGGDTIQSRGEIITESLNFDRNVSVNLEGGFDCHYTLGNGVTRINGNMSVNDGTVTVGNIVLE